MGRDVDEGSYQELQSLKAEAQTRLDKLDSHMRHESGPVSPDFAEQASETVNDETIVALREQLGEEIAMINAALKRIDEGVYGTCAKCGQRIEPARLQAIPFVERCIDCSSV
ncbi:MAG: TraR/DksA family transcriptional regulator [Pseudomonadales bacterium]